MAITQTPQHYTSHDLTWGVRGKEYERNTVVELLLRGKYAKILRERPIIIHNGMALLMDEAIARVPRFTEHLANSMHLQGQGRSRVFVFGPPKFDRNRVVARILGREAEFLRNRTIRRRQATARGDRKGPGGRVRLTGFYGIPANRHSSRPQWLDESIDAASAVILQTIQQFEEAELSLSQIEAALARRAF